jgi:nitrate/nitrite transporter NarK
MIPTIYQILAAEVPAVIQFISNLVCFIGAAFVIALIVASDFKNN